MKLIFADFDTVAQLNAFISLTAEIDTGHSLVESVETIHSSAASDKFRLWYWYKELK